MSKVIKCHKVTIKPICNILSTYIKYHFEKFQLLSLNE